jgi:hypothetical protein
MIGFRSHIILIKLASRFKGIGPFTVLQQPRPLQSLSVLQLAGIALKKNRTKCFNFDSALTSTFKDQNSKLEAK